MQLLTNLKNSLALPDYLFVVRSLSHNYLTTILLKVSMSLEVLDLTLVLLCLLQR
jgi:hypothetical protein